MKYRRIAIFNGNADHAKLNMELQNLARAGYKTSIKFTKETAIEPDYLNVMVQQVSKATKSKLSVRFDGSDTPTKLNQLFIEIERTVR